MAGNMDFEGKFGIITGAANGIGRAAALELGQRGAGLILADIEAAPLESLDKELKESGAQAVAVQVDVGREEQVEA